MRGLTLVQVRVHVLTNGEIFRLFRAKIHYVLDEILDVAHLVRDAVDDSAEQSCLLAVLLAYVGDADYGGDRLRRLKLMKLIKCTFEKKKTHQFNRLQKVKTKRRKVQAKPCAIVANRTF